MNLKIFLPPIYCAVVKGILQQIITCVPWVIYHHRSLWGKRCECDAPWVKKQDSFSELTWLNPFAVRLYLRETTECMLWFDSRPIPLWEQLLFRAIRVQKWWNCFLSFFSNILTHVKNVRGQVANHYVRFMKRSGHSAKYSGLKSFQQLFRFDKHGQKEPFQRRFIFSSYLLPVLLA